mmetsp:Transcript_649/g.1539  ORF Transcript_649/g.1539 Transcript_649/m.1539 type:complete len:203 (-) Transcript_649:1249-1857(-)
MDGTRAISVQYGDGKPPPPPPGGAKPPPPPSSASPSGTPGIPGIPGIGFLPGKVRKIPGGSSFCGMSFKSSSVRLRSTLISPRITSIWICCPTLSLSSVRYRSDEFFIRFPSSSTMTSPRMRRPLSSRLVALTPARHAGPASRASNTSTPPRPSCSTAASGANVMPMMGRVTRPNLMIWSTMPDTMSDGSANPTPEDDPDVE